MKTIPIKHCNDCPHLDHSGAFTPGGAKPICGHSCAAEKTTLRRRKNKHHWENRRLLKRTAKGKLTIPK